MEEIKMCCKYIFKGNINELQSQISTAVNRFNEEHPDQYTTLQASVNGNQLKIGLERSGHSNGFWYKATLLNLPGGTLIEGKITEENPPKWYE